MAEPICVLGLDPGFASAGYALLELRPDTKPQVVGLGVIRTEKSDAKRKVFASDDNFRRAREIARELRSIVDGHKIYAFCAESMSFPRNASAANKMALCWGVLSDICEELGIPMVMVSPKELKRAVSGNASASKEDVMAVMDKMFSGEPMRLLDEARVPAGQREHPYDALAAAVACLNSEVIRAIRRVAS